MLDCILIDELIEMINSEIERYKKLRKSAFDFEEKEIFAEGEAALSYLKFKVKNMHGHYK